MSQMCVWLKLFPVLGWTRVHKIFCMDEWSKSWVVLTAFERRSLDWEWWERESCLQSCDFVPNFPRQLLRDRASCDFNAWARGGCGRCLFKLGGQQMAFQVWTVGFLYLETNGLKSPYSLFLWRCCKFWGTWVSSCFAATKQHQNKEISPRQKKEFRHVSLACALKWSISKNIVEESNYWQLA